MDKKKIKSWVIKIGVLFILFSLIYPRLPSISGMKGKIASLGNSFSVGAVAKPRRSGSGIIIGEKCNSFSQEELKLKKKVVKVFPGQWTDWEKVPPGVDWRISPSCKIRGEFGDGTFFEDSPDSFNNFGVKRGIFKFISEATGEVVITIS